MYIYCKLLIIISICLGFIFICIYWYGYKWNFVIVKYEILGIY